MAGCAEQILACKGDANCSAAAVKGVGGNAVLLPGEHQAHGIQLRHPLFAAELQQTEQGRALQECAQTQEAAVAQCALPPATPQTTPSPSASEQRKGKASLLTTETP